MADDDNDDDLMAPPAGEEHRLKHLDSGVRCTYKHVSRKRCWHCSECDRFIRPEAFGAACKVRVKAARKKKA